MRLTEKQKQDEIERLDKRSLFFLNAFSIFWSTLIFFIIQQRDAEPMKTALANLSKLFPVNMVNIVSVWSYILFLILLLLIPITIMGLSVNSLTGYLKLKKGQGIVYLMKEKYRLLFSYVSTGFMASFLLLVYLCYLYFSTNTAFVTFMNFLFGVVFMDFCVVILMIFWPIISFCKNFSTWGWNINSFRRISEILGSLGASIYVLVIWLKTFHITGLVFMIWLFILSPFMIVNTIRFGNKLVHLITERVEKMTLFDLTV